MAFDRLQALGQEKFTAILNGLMRGENAAALARMIQQDWNEFSDVAEKTLTQQLNRLRQAAAEGAFGKKVAAQIVKGATPQIKLLEGVSQSSVERMEELAAIQRGRVLSLVEKEKNMPLPVGVMLTATNAVFNDYSKLLQDIQKVRFDLGLDEFRGVVSTFKGAAMTVTQPDGSSVHKQVFEAVTTLEEIFAKRKIPQIAGE